MDRERPPGRPPAAPGAGAAWMIAGMSAIAVVDALAKELARSLHGVQVAWGYFLSMFVCLLAVSAARGVPVAALLRTHRTWLQVARACCLVLSLSCLFFSLAWLPLAAATTIGFTAPLFIVALSGPMLGERVGAARWAVVLAGMAGALLVARPGTGLLHWSAMVALLGAFFFAQFNIVTRKLGASERPAATLFHTFGIGMLLLSLALPVVWQPITPAGWLLFALGGVLGLFAHFAIFRSLSLADASAVAPLSYVRLVWATLLGYLLFDDVPDGATLVGGAVIVLCGLYVLRAGAR
jgi:drug/metabolite transporter (DMT)-like permease